MRSSATENTSEVARATVATTCTTSRARPCANAVLRGSANFAGEFSILAGVFGHGWGYSAVGAAAIVLAALYVLRPISAILHERRGSAVSDDPDDLVSGELALVVPLVAILAVLSAWPAAISERSFPADEPATFIQGQGEGGFGAG